jgi:sugar phosphate isomerase/epimerase
VLIGVDTYSYHRALDPLPGEGPGRRLDDLLPSIAVAGAEIVSLSAGLESFLEAGALRRLRQILEDLRLAAQVSAGPISPPGRSPEEIAAPIVAALDAAAFLGAPVARVVTGWFRSSSTDVATETGRLIAALQYFVPHARARGVRLAIENHADLRLAELRVVLAAVDSEWVGVTFDPQNCPKVADDPVAFTTELMPRILTTHVRDHRPESVFEPGRRSRYGVSLIHCPLGEGILPLREMLGLLAREKPDVPWIVEDISGVIDEHEAVVHDLAWLNEFRHQQPSP